MKNNAKSSVIAVLGMHRSGTSVIARSLQAMGVGLGHNLIPAIANNNDKGFFEDLEINVLNEEMLNFCGKSWHSVSPIQSADVDLLCDHGYLLRAIELLQDKLSKHLIFGFKDPRTSKLMSFWSKVFAVGGFDVQFVFALRNPLSVVRSLEKRDGLDAEHAYLLWIDSILSGLSFMADQKVVVVDYDQLLSTPEEELQRISNHLSLHLDNYESEKFCHEFLDKNLRHTSFSLSDIYEDISALPLVKDIYAFLKDVQIGKVTIEYAFQANLINHWLEEQHKLCPLLRLLDKGNSQIASLNQAAVERDSQIASLSQSLSEQDQQIQLIIKSRSWRYISLLSKMRVMIALIQKTYIRIKLDGLFATFKFFFVKLNKRLNRIVDVTFKENNHQDIPRLSSDNTLEKFLPYTKNPNIEPKVKLIAFYLPQFHPFPENDEWWGKGFTEWTNVGKATPNFVGHYQPHCPIHFGYYDLRIKEIMEEQSKIAKEYGLYGFSYYFYWFGGKTLMEEPLKQMLLNPKVDMPFCLTWANENWTRRWDGRESDVLISQQHSDEDSLAFIKYLMKYFKDPRYIKVNGKPVLIIYRANIIPNINVIAGVWRSEMIRNGFAGIYLVAAQTFGIKSPLSFDFDAAVEFPPHTVSSSEINDCDDKINKNFDGKLYSYDQVVQNAVVATDQDYKVYKTVMLSWDNTARKQNSSHIFCNFSIGRYKQWLSSKINKVYWDNKYIDDKFVFINAWNEWAEGTHLEPDRKYGFSYLQATYECIKHYDAKVLSLIAPLAPQKVSNLAVVLHLYYLEVWNDIKDKLVSSFQNNPFDLYVTVCDSIAIPLIKKDFPNANVMLVENRGRDILPFIRVMKLIKHLNYEIVCKLHSKRSLYRNDGDLIRNEILDSLIGNQNKIKKIINLFKIDSKLGIVGPKNYILKHTDKNMTFDKELVNLIFHRMNLNFNYHVFVAGSMFWFRPEAFSSLINSIEDSDFSAESGLADGTFAHALERSFSFAAENADFTTKGI